MTTLLEIMNLHVSFHIYKGNLQVLNGVNFTVGEKERVGLIGETGCGKTTTMKTILGILAHNAKIPSVEPKGKVLFKTKDVLGFDSRELQQIRRGSISMIFQDPTASLNPVFKIGEQLRDVIKYSEIGSKEKELSKKEIKEKAIEILKAVALPDPERIMDNYPVQLSGGMRQRVCIAMSLVSAKDLLIADEPGTSLDVTIEDQVLRLLKALVEERGTSVILISHALGTVKGLADRTYVMYGGTMVEATKTEDLFSDPLHPYTRGLFKAVPQLTGGGVPEGIRGRVLDYLNPPKGCRFIERCDYAMPICEKSVPQLFKAGDAHEVACFLYGDLH